MFINIIAFFFKIFHIDVDYLLYISNEDYILSNGVLNVDEEDVRMLRDTIIQNM